MARLIARSRGADGATPTSGSVAGAAGTAPGTMALARNLAAAAGEIRQVRPVPLDRIRANPYQPRLRMNEEKLQELMASLASPTGQLEPIGYQIEQGPDGPLYVSVFGHRRIEAARRLGWTTIKGILVEGDLAMIAIAENLQRDDLSAIEMGRALRAALERGRSRSVIGGELGLDKSRFSRFLAVAERLDDDIQAAVLDGTVTVSDSVLIELAQVKAPDLRRRLWERAARGELTAHGVRQAAERAQRGEAERPVDSNPFGRRIESFADGVARHVEAVIKRDGRLGDADRAALEKLYHRIRSVIDGGADDRNRGSDRRQK